MAQVGEAGSEAASEAVPGGAGARTIGEESPEVRKIGELLRTGKAPADKGEKAPDGEPDVGGAPDEPLVEGEGGGSPDEPVDETPLTLAELAKTLGVKEGELFDEVKVEVEGVGDDGTKSRQSVSLGELRRGFVGAKELEREREKFEQDADKRSLEFMQTRAQLEYLGALIEPHAPREVVERMTQALSERDARERALLLEAVPEWKDAARFTADRAVMIEFLKQWGFSPADVYGIADHRIARFVRDMARDHKRKAEAERKARSAGNGQVKRGQAPDGRVGVTPLRAKLAKIVSAGKAATTQEGKTQAIGALLRSTHKR
jgi:hypothetical protein